MTRTGGHPQPVVSGRVPPELYEAARIGAGLPPTASAGQVIRYALAITAGRDPAAVPVKSYRGRGFRPK